MDETLRVGEGSTWMSRSKFRKLVHSQLPSMAWYSQMRTALCQNLELFSPAWTLHQGAVRGSPGFPGLLIFAGEVKSSFLYRIFLDSYANGSFLAIAILAKWQMMA